MEKAVELEEFINQTATTLQDKYDENEIKYFMSTLQDVLDCKFD